MKQLLLVLFTAVSFSLAGQNWGAGIRLGDPSGITIKKYNGSNSLELNLGRSHILQGNGYYDDRIDDWYKDRKYREYRILSQSQAKSISVQFHFLKQKAISNIGDNAITGLDFYYGAGAQFRYQEIKYVYSYTNFDNIYFDNATHKISDVDIGIDALIGLEYKFKDVPISAFLDVNVFVEIVDDPFELWPQTGLGGRYHF